MKPTRTILPLQILIFAVTALTQQTNNVPGAAQLLPSRIVNLKAPDGIPLQATYAAEAKSGPDKASQIDAIFAVYDKADSPGCAVGVVRDGEYVYKRSFGRGSIELGVPLTPASMFYLGSVSKQFTAASVVLAAEQGYLSLDDDLRKWIPEMPDYGHMITLQQMLHHTSGIRDVLGLMSLAGMNYEDIHPLQELLALVAQQKQLNFAPGAQYQYSNSNYMLLAEVVHPATGKPLSQFAQ